MLMEKSQIDLKLLTEQLDKLGMSIFGRLELSTDLTPDNSDNYSNLDALLIGNVGGAMWKAFEASKELSDGAKNPMDRWTRRVIDDLIKTLSAEAVYPFDRPLWPFQRIAQSATGVQASPLGLFIHPEYGLWQAYRALIIFGRNEKLPSQFSSFVDKAEILIHPCDECEAKPCLSACPVAAFDGVSLSTQKCFSHIDSMVEPNCMSIGCRSRDACPIGAEYRYPEAQIQFHMASFRN